MSVVRPPARSLVASLLLLALAGCGSDSGGGGFELRTTDRAASPSAAIEVKGLWMVYLASEGFTGPVGTDLNGDGDTLDEVAVVVNLSTTDTDELGVAADRAVVQGNEIYLVVDEAEDGTDWNGVNGATDLVLLHWSNTAGVVALVDTLGSGGSPLLFTVEDRLYYESDTSPVGADDTSLRYLANAAPLVPVLIESAVGAGQFEPELLAEDDGLLFLGLDEDGVSDFNGDGDQGDQHVLALLDGTDPAARVLNTELAMVDGSAPVAALVLGASDWLVAFLVDEIGQGGVNLNDQALFSQPLLPESCLGTPDLDTNDQVLHYLDFSDFAAGTTTPVNTGLVGSDRVLALTNFVATIASESDSNCDLNADGDTSDDIARWVRTTLPVTPDRDANRMHALASALPGGARGLAVLDNRLVGVIDEAQDNNGDAPHNHDGKLLDHQLVAWIDPAVSNPTWRFTHQNSGNPNFGTGVFDDDGDSEPFAGTSWMAPEAVDGRLGLTFLEEVPGTNPDVGSLNTNLDCSLVAKDTDKTDGLPVWADFETGPTLDFDGVGYAVDKINAGIEIAGAFAFFRVSEADDNRDYNNDGVANDVVLMRNPLTTCGPVPMATSSSVASQVIATDRDRGAAFLSSETQAGVDFNGDGDTNDLVVRYFLF